MPFFGFLSSAWWIECLHLLYVKDSGDKDA